MKAFDGLLYLRSLISFVVKSFILFTVFAAIFFRCGNPEERAVQTNKLSPDTLNNQQTAVITEHADSHNKITGLLQTSGLQPDEAKALGIRGGHYQLISQQAYFLEGHDSLKAFLGQCLTLSGAMAEGWEENPQQLNGQTTYNRRLFVVERVHPQLYSYCHFSDTLNRQPQGREVTYTGQVERMQRPAPDIAYDYQLRLQKPYRDANHPVQPGRLVQTLPLSTVDFEVLSKMEAAVRQKKRLRIQGVQHQGYAESQAVWVVAADSLAL